ncbi:hypothetical protein [uncultured Erythrobacter sp.]|uniref:hypothetical protein n=1 Tax=uncultured Erythrobacter sp. TaxID=263913 RepID=UPI00263A384A|nr:hypothetical protein [uncultured Erythrobacter sp.]
MTTARTIAKGLTFAGLAFAWGASSVGFAQQSEPEVPRDEAAFVNQAPEDSTSKVYFPDTITPESVAAARARADERQRQIEAAKAQRSTPVTQVSAQGGSNEVAQLSDGSSTAVLAQLSAAERRVLLDAVEGTDICERGSDIPALQALCETRLETRSEEFAQERSDGSAEDNLLGGGLDAGRAATLQAAIRRLANVDANPGDFDNQVLASVTLNRQSASDAQSAEADRDPAADLSQETQTLVGAIVQQLGGGN